MCKLFTIALLFLQNFNLLLVPSLKLEYNSHNLQLLYFNLLLTVTINNVLKDFELMISTF